MPGIMVPQNVTCPSRPSLLLISSLPALLPLSLAAPLPVPQKNLKISQIRHNFDTVS